MKKIGYAVVGLGIGRAHVDAAAKNPKANLIAVCDLVQSKLDAVKAIYPDTLTYTDFDEMLKNPDIDIVSIAVPSGKHAELAVKALEAGKNVLIEKPIDITPAAAYKIEEARIRTGKKAAVVFQTRWNACMIPFKEAVESGRFGKIILGTFAVKWNRTQEYYDNNGGWRGTWEMDGGGSLMNQAVHTVDLMQWLMGDVESVTSTMGIYTHKIDTEDLTASIIKFKSGATASFVSSTCIYPERGTDIQLYGEKGSVEVASDQLKIWKFADSTPEEEEDMIKRYAGNAAATAIDPTLITGHASQINDIIDAVIEDRQPTITPTEGIKAVRIINAVYESAKTGKTVYFD